MPNPDQLQQSGLAALRWEPGVSAAHIGVAAYAEVITPTGVVDSYAEMHSAEVAARDVKSVLAVAQEIEVQVPFERQRGDDQIALAAFPG